MKYFLTLVLTSVLVFMYIHRSHDVQQTEHTGSSAIPITKPPLPSIETVVIKPSEVIVDPTPTTPVVADVASIKPVEPAEEPPEVIAIEIPRVEPTETVVAAVEPIVAIKPKPVKSTNPRDTKRYIPPQAFDYFDTIKQEQERLMPDFAYPYYFAGLIEHESCIHLQHKKCWNPASKLDTKRELGIGLGQITKAYKADGSIRFDALSDLRRAHMSELKELSWSNIAQRPDLQIRSMMLMSNTSYKALYQMQDPYQRLAATDSAYNGGLSSVKKRRQVCGLKVQCDPQIWFGHLEKMVVKSTKPLYAGRSAQQINDEHVHDVLKTRMPKYQPWFL